MYYAQKLQATSVWASKIEQLAREKGELQFQARQALEQKEIAESQVSICSTSLVCKQCWYNTLSL